MQENFVGTGMLIDQNDGVHRTRPSGEKQIYINPFEAATISHAGVRRGRTTYHAILHEVTHTFSK